jgi:hypothetical protein
VIEEEAIGKRVPVLGHANVEINGSKDRTGARIETFLAPPEKPSVPTETKARRKKSQK